ncbi:glucose-6-phosphate dehydrogenase [Arthrobacter jiangjiafuii]|uniref:Glucose-6-phosphate dehydrogenase n=1 Tax=Arthrobacter jiangjiafuii TaxID=2817475 RepID=A0A975M351_9MICC|nr:glucose-6-phosphate dehydrogenase [Arthrobacter jiangjiafuii]MBP3043573.1 glucose-6-phosphate dehydrogenase [Arthrobacter jiangjiafuii]QWC09085.1 glucose-6-phosphate dehydrogenase [Arthrobacter jiangjiafuii]
MNDTSPLRTLLILGGTGDLSQRLLLPGLGQLIASGRAPENLTVTGSGSRDWSDGDWQDRLLASFAAAREDADEQGRRALDAAVESGSYLRVDLQDPERLVRDIAGLQAPLALYFALPPGLTQSTVAALKPGDLPDETRLVLEKPFGTDEESARELNRLLADLVPEDHIYRVDHFLGMATVMNILGLRFTNRILEPVWNNLHIDRVEIVFDEELGLEGRAAYYDGAGALRDMIQSHLLHTMAVIAMGAPATLGERDLRDLLAATLRASSVPEDYRASTRRARWTAGEINGEGIEAYADSPGVDPARNTETLAEVEIRIDNERWAGVPFILRSGKALGKQRKEAVVTFKPVSHLPTGFTGAAGDASRLRISFAPARLELELNVNGPADVFDMERTGLAAPMHKSTFTPYGEVLDGILSGDPLVSVRADVAEECWRIVDPVLAAWAADQVPLESYPAGTAGPPGWKTSRADL